MSGYHMLKKFQKHSTVGKESKQAILITNGPLTVRVKWRMKTLVIGHVERKKEMTEFKKGDWVRCTHNAFDEFTAGKIYKVRKDGDDHCCVESDDSGRENGWSGKYFQLVRRADEGFKVGDVVSYNCPLFGKDWQNVTLTRVSNTSFGYRGGWANNSKGEEGLMGLDRLTLIEPAPEPEIKFSGLRSPDGKIEIDFESSTITLKGFEEGSHELTAKEAIKIADDAIVSVNDVVDVYQALIDNGFVIRKA